MDSLASKALPESVLAGGGSEAEEGKLREHLSSVTAEL